MRRSNQFIVSAAALSVLGCVATGSGFAADMPYKAQAYKAPPAVIGYSWTGFYVGANGGYAWSDRSDSYGANDPVSASLFAGNPIAGNTRLPDTSFKVRGGFGGVQLGYNWQLNPKWVLGLEADFDFGDIDGSGTSVNIIGGVTPAAVVASEKIAWFGTARARLGHLFTNTLLIYATGGFAYGRVEQDANWTLAGTGGLAIGPFGVFCTAGVPCYSGSSSSIQSGWTAGGGAEWAVWKNVTLKAEYLYVNLGSNSFTMNGVPIAGLNQSTLTVNTGDVDFHSVRAGLNWKFN